MRSDNGLVVVINDPHSNSKLGLCPPFYNIDEGGGYVANEFQLWLWSKWKKLWKHIKKVKKKTGLPLILVVNGDTHEGDHHGTSLIITRNTATMLRLAVAVLEPALDIADRVYIIRGTPTHTGQGAWMEEELAEDIGAVPQNAEKEIYSWYHLSLEVGGVLFDIKHHPESVSRRPWTEGADSIRIAEMVQSAYVRTGDRIPDIAIRAHIHAWRDSGRMGHRVRVFGIPSWQGPTGFVYRIGSGNPKITEHGGMYFICKNGEYREYVKSYRPIRDAPERFRL